MIEADNLFFINVPPEIEDEYFEKILNYINDNMDLDKDTSVHLHFLSFYNIMGKACFKAELKYKNSCTKAIDNESNFLIFIQ
jgi:hypothetical protein